MLPRANFMQKHYTDLSVTNPHNNYFIHVFICTYCSLVRELSQEWSYTNFGGDMLGVRVGRFRCALKNARWSKFSGPFTTASLAIMSSF